MKEIELKIFPRRNLSTFPNEESICSYGYYYEFIDGLFYFMQCKDNRSYKIVIYTLYRLNYDYTRTKISELRFNTHDSYKPLVTEFFFKMTEDKSFNLYIRFENNNIIKYRVFNTDGKFLQELDTRRPHKENMIDVEYTKDWNLEYNGFDLSFLYHDDYYVHKVNDDEIVLVPDKIPCYDPHISKSKKQTMYVHGLNGITNDEYDEITIDFDVYESLETPELVYDNLTYDDLDNGRIKIGYIDMDTDLGIRNDTIYLFNYVKN